MFASKELIEKIQAGNIFAFEEFCRINKREIDKICYNFLKNTEEAKDTRQDVMYEILKSNHSFRNEAEFTTWVFKVIKNKCNDQLRKNKLRRTIPIVIENDNKLILSNEPLIEKQDLPDQIFIDKDLRLYLKSLIIKLNPQQQQVIKLRFYEDYKINEIALAMKLSVSRIEKILKASNAKLYQLYEK